MYSINSILLKDLDQNILKYDENLNHDVFYKFYFIKGSGLEHAGGYDENLNQDVFYKFYFIKGSGLEHAGGYDEKLNQVSKLKDIMHKTYISLIKQLLLFNL